MTTEHDATDLVESPDVAAAASDLDDLFAQRLAHVGWSTYFDHDSGRVVTNARSNELEVVSAAAGLPCEIVARYGNGTFCRIGAAKVRPNTSAQQGALQRWLAFAPSTAG